MLKMKKRPRVLLADPHAFLVDAVAPIIEQRCELAGTFNDGRALLSAASRIRPDIIVLDVAMPGLGGLDLVRRLKQLLPEAKLILLTASADPYNTRQALRAGASGYLLKTASSVKELIEAIEEALAGRVYVTPPARKGMASSLAGRPEQARHTDTLTLRQRDVLKALAGGKTMRKAAESLQVSPRTIAAHKYRIMEKLGVESNAELMCYAVRRGLSPN